MPSARILTLLLLGLDTFASLAVFNLVSWLRAVQTDAGTLQLIPYLAPLAFIVIAIYLIDGYKPRTDMMSLDYTSQHIIAMSFAMLATLVVVFVFITGAPPTDAAGVVVAGRAPTRGMLASSFGTLQSSRVVIAFGFMLLAPITLSYRRSVYQRFAARSGTRSLVFLGNRQSCLAFRDECQRVGLKQPVVYTVVSEESAAPFVSDADPVRPFGEVIDRVRRGDLAVEAIILRESSRELQPEVARQLVTLYFEGVPTYTLELFHQIYWRKIPLYRLNQTWLFQEGFQIAREPVYERLKRISDIVMAGIGLIFALPVIAIAGLAVWIGDRGPVFFRQPRVGRSHVAFRLAKLRTMRPVDGITDPYTRPGDVRITPVGRFLRATRIDELPQLWNVLRGDMSLIGPRPEWSRLVEEYEKEIPCYYFRHLVKPGITGWAQVNYPYGASTGDTERKLEYDLYYIRHFSFTLDASIVLKTIHIMLFGKGR